MKKVFTLILTILLVLTLGACNSEAEIDPPREAEKELVGRIITYNDFLTEMSKRIDLDDYTLEDTYYPNNQEYIYTSKTNCEIKKDQSNFAVEIDGIKFNLPITTQDFVDLGFKLSYIDAAKEGHVNLNTYITAQLFNVTSPKGNTFSIYSISKNGRAVPVKDSIVMQVSCSFYGDTINYGEGERNDAPEICFFKKITEKSSIDGILKKLKDPQRINFSTSQYQGETTLTSTQFYYVFSDDTYNGSLTVTTMPVRDKSIERTSYVTDFSYLIDYESIKNS